MTRWAPWSPLRSVALAAILSAAVAAGVYANAVENGFAYDDEYVLVRNTPLQSPANLPDLLFQPYWASHELGRDLGLWRPATTALLSVQWAAWDGEPAYFHAVNVALHAGVTALAVALLAHLISVPGAFLGGLIFAVHPVHVEAVSNVVGLAELLGTAFFLGACVLFLRHRRRLRPAHVLGIGVLFLLALLSKEITVTLPAVLILLDAYFEDLRASDIVPYLRRRWKVFACLAVVTGGVFAARIHVLGAVASPLPPYGSELLSEVPRIWTVATLWPHYARLLFLPLDLSADYGAGVIDVAVGWTAEGVVGVLLALSVLVLALLGWRRKVAGEPSRALSLGVLWFCVTILPVSNLLFVAGVLLAERTLYLPSVGFCLAAGWVLAALLRRRRVVGTLAAGGVVLLLGVRSWLRTPTWATTQTVAERLVTDHPESARAQWIAADVFRQRGRPGLALRAYRHAVGAVDDDYDLLIRVVRLLMDEERWKDADRIASFAWRRQPDRPSAPVLAAAVRARRADWEGTLEAADAALSMDPSNATMHQLRARALERLGRLDEAVEARRRAIAHGEGDHWDPWLRLARLLARRHDTATARATLDSALTRAPEGGVVACQIDSLESVWAGRSDVGNCRSFAESNDGDGSEAPEAENRE